MYRLRTKKSFIQSKVTEGQNDLENNLHSKRIYTLNRRDVEDIIIKDNLSKYRRLEFYSR